jgi:hypothetical protein
MQGHFWGENRDWGGSEIQVPKSIGPPDNDGVISILNPTAFTVTHLLNWA